MPREAAERLVVRLRARKGIEAEETTGFDIDGLLTYATGWDPNKEAFDDYSVKHDRNQSSLWNFPAEFAESLLEENELRIFNHRVAQLVWTNPRIVALMRRTRHYHDKRFEIESAIKDFESGQSRRLKNPLAALRELSDSRGALERIVRLALPLAENAAFREQHKPILSSLSSLCQEIVADRKRQGSRIKFNVKIFHGPSSFKNFFRRLKARREAETSVIKIFFKKR